MFRPTNNNEMCINGQYSLHRGEERDHIEEDDASGTNYWQTAGSQGHERRTKVMKTPWGSTDMTNVCAQLHTCFQPQPASSSDSGRGENGPRVPTLLSSQGLKPVLSSEHTSRRRPVGIFFTSKRPCCSGLKCISTAMRFGDKRLIAIKISGRRVLALTLDPFMACACPAKLRKAWSKGIYEATQL